MGHGCHSCRSPNSCECDLGYSKKMNIIEVLQAVKDGRKMRHVGWPADQYLCLSGQKNIVKHTSTGPVPYEFVANLIEASWEEYEELLSFSTAMELVVTEHKRVSRRYWAVNAYVFMDSNVIVNQNCHAFVFTGKDILANDWYVWKV